MRVPLSWLKEYVDITLSVEELAYRLTLAGLEVASIEYVGIPTGEVEQAHKAVPTSADHLVWDRDKIVVGHILEVKAHPNADRLVLATVDSGLAEPEVVVTGAPNLYPYKDQGPINPPLISPYAREGAEVIDGHGDGVQRLIIKPKNLRGIDNKSMVCSPMELGLAGGHDGILLFETDAPPGTPLQDVLGDAILDIDLTPNMARNYSVIGIAREIAALTGQKLRYPDTNIHATGPSIEGQVQVEIRELDVNPRFTTALIKGIEIKPSPEWMQRRLIQSGMRPINNMVDITNYVMLETGQPLHAFDYDVLVERAGGKPPTIITRYPKPGETLTTLDGVTRQLDPFTILVADTKGALSLGGIMGGAESEIYDASSHVLDAQGIETKEGEDILHGKADSRPQSTQNVLLEAAAWNLINIRRTLQAQRERGKEISSEAAARFSRGVHPDQAEFGLRRAIELMRELGGGEIAQGIVNESPRPYPTVVVDLHMKEVERLLGIALTEKEVSAILEGLEFKVQPAGNGVLRVTVPNHRLDIGLLPDDPNADIADTVGQADLIEEIARIYGYDRIPNTLIADHMPPQRSNPLLEGEEKVRDALVRAGLQEIITYRLTTPEREALLTPTGTRSDWPDGAYITLANPMSADKAVMRHTLLSSVLDVVAANARWVNRQAVFEIGKVYLPQSGQKLPDEPTHLALAMTSHRNLPTWQDSHAGTGNLMDYYDLKGVVENLVKALHLADASFTACEHSSFFPGRTACLTVGGAVIGAMGELHPLVCEAYDLPEQPILVAEFDLEAMLSHVTTLDTITPVSTYPAIYQDIAVVVRESIAASDVENAIWQAGGNLLREVHLFDLYQNEQMKQAGEKSLAYALTFQAEDKTLWDKDADSIRAKIIRALESRVGAKLRT